MNYRAFLRFCIFASLIIPLILIWIVGFTDIPLGVVGQWVWKRNNIFNPSLYLIAKIFTALLVAILVAINLDRTKKPDKKKTWVSVIIIIISSLVVNVSILESGHIGMGENALAPLDKFATGYLEDALYFQKGDNFVDKVLTPLPNEIPLHRHVHPPGNMLLSKLVLDSKISVRGLMPETARALDILAKQGMIMSTVNYPIAINATLTLVFIFIISLSLGYLLLAKIMIDRNISLIGLATLLICFTSGAAILFLGHYDTLYFFLTALALYIFHLSERMDNKIKKYILYGLLGLILGAGAIFTLGYGSVIVMFGIVLLLRKDRWISLGSYAVGGIIAALSTKMNVFAIALKCWENHRGFNIEAGRNYFPWVFFNVTDGLLFAGVIVSLIPLVALFFWKSRRHSRAHVIGCIMWLFLIFSGSALGEIGRLIILFIPILLWIGIPYLTSFVKNSPKYIYMLILCAIVLALSQIIVCREALKLVLID